IEQLRGSPNTQKRATQAVTTTNTAPTQPQARASKVESSKRLIRKAKSKRSATISTKLSSKWMFNSSSGCLSINAGSNGAKLETPKDIGAETRTTPDNWPTCSAISDSISAP